MRSPLVLLLMTAGCSVSPDLSDLPCPCGEGFVCLDERCVESADSSLPDALVDVGVADVSPTDSDTDGLGPADASETDTGSFLQFPIEEEGGTGINFDWIAERLRLDSAPGNGTFESAVIDAGQVVTWTRFTWEPLAAYGRAFGRVPDPLYEDGRVDGLELSLLMPFDRGSGRLSEGDEYPDESVAARVGQVFGTGASSIPDGVFGTALRVTDVSRVEVSMSSGLMPVTGDITWSFWARSSQPCDTNNRVFLGSETPNGADRSHIWIGCWDGGSCRRGRVGGVWASDLQVDRDKFICGSRDISDGEWHLLTLRKSGDHFTDGRLELFVDGDDVFSESVNYTEAFQFNEAQNLWFGNFVGGYPTSVDIDAATFFSRRLDDEEIVQLYQRGRQALGFEIRACEESTCAGVPYQNLRGEVGGVPTGDDGSSDTLPLSEALAGLSGRYAQVRVTMSSSIDQKPTVRSMRLFAQ